MNFDEIQKTWQSPQNRPSAPEMEKIKMNMIAELRRRRRGNLGLLILSLIPLVVITGKVAMHLIAPDPSHTPVDLSREWAILPFFILPWLGWWVMARLHRRHQRRHAAYDRSVSASVAALLDENRGERSRYKVISLLLLASVPALWLVVAQLRAVGKAGDEILLPALVLYPAYVVLVLLWSRFHYRRKTLPRQRELESLLAAYSEK